MYFACTSKCDGGIWRWQGVVYVDKPEDALRKGVELVEGGMVEEYGPAARGFVGNCRWDGVVGVFEGILEGVVQRG